MRASFGILQGRDGTPGRAGKPGDPVSVTQFLVPSTLCITCIRFEGTHVNTDSVPVFPFSFLLQGKDGTPGRTGKTGPAVSAALFPTLQQQSTSYLGDTLC